MKIPNVKCAVVPQSKVVDYLLSRTHPVGRHKAEFFESFGFSNENWKTLAEVLQSHPQKHEVFRHTPSPYGMRYLVDGIILAPDGRQPMLRSVWFVDSEDEAEIPRFVSAYPIKRSKDDERT